MDCTVQTCVAQVSTYFISARYQVIGQSVSQVSCLVMFNSLQPHGLQHPGFPAHQQLPELLQTHVHQVSDAIQPSHPLSSPSPPDW